MRRELRLVLLTAHLLTGTIMMSRELSLVLLTCPLTYWHDNNEKRATFGVTYMPTYSLA